MDNQSITHTRWNCTYHIVFIPKYRRKIMYGELKRDIVEIIKKLCEMKQVALIDGRVCKDHIHMYVAIPPKMSVSEFMSYLKGKSTLMLFDRHPEYLQIATFCGQQGHIRRTARNIPRTLTIMPRKVLYMSST